MPKPRNHAIYVDDMSRAADAIAEYLGQYDFNQFVADNKTVDAVLRNFEIIGEASARIPDDIQAMAPNIDWRGLKAFRNVVAHFYRGVDLEIVWRLIKEKLPVLRTELDILSARLAQ